MTMGENGIVQCRQKGGRKKDALCGSLRGGGDVFPIISESQRKEEKWSRGDRGTFKTMDNVRRGGKGKSLPVP